MTTIKLKDLSEGYNGESFQHAGCCPVCDGPSLIAHVALNAHPDMPFPFDYLVCKQCKHGWIDPMPTQGFLNYLYAVASRSVIGEGWINGETKSRLTIPEQLVAREVLRPGIQSQSYFELGVGKGNLYSRFLDKDWRCFGVEPGSWGRSFPGVEQNLELIPGDFKANVVVALDVLEHLSDPVHMIKCLRSIAAPDARFYCAVPNRESARAKIGRKNWRMLRPLGHVNFWSKKSISIALEKGHFKISKIIKTDLWEPRPIYNARNAMALAIEKFGLGDQLIVLARAI